VPFGYNAFAKENNIKYSIALVGMSMDYKEYDSSHTLLDSENSSLGKIIGYDMSLGYLFNPTGTSIDEISLDVSQVSGKSDYVGAILGSGGGYGSLKQTTVNSFIDASLSYKHTQRYNNMFDLFYGLGAGYHAWYRELSTTQAELYSWYSLRPSVGVTLIMDQFSAGIFGEYQYGFNAMMSSSKPTMDFKLGGADIISIGFPLRYNFRKNLELFTIYTLSKQEIKKSNEVLSGGLYYYEPDSTSYQNYLKFGATFKF
jgi:hypothetical protein